MTILCPNLGVIAFAALGKPSPLYQLLGTRQLTLTFDFDLKVHEDKRSSPLTYDLVLCTIRAQPRSMSTSIPKTNVLGQMDRQSCTYALTHKHIDRRTLPNLLSRILALLKLASGKSEILIQQLAILGF